MPKPRRQHKPRQSSEGYSFADVVRLTSATRSNLIFWADRGIITAAIEDTAGPGYPRRFSYMNLVEAELCAEMNSFKVPARLIADAAEDFRLHHQRQLSIINNGPTDGATAFTEAQRIAYANAIANEIVSSRDRGRGFKGTKHSHAHYVSVVMARTDRNEEQALRAAAAWQRYRSDEKFRFDHFCGLFVHPAYTVWTGQELEPGTSIHSNFTHALDWNWAIGAGALVLNLANILTKVEKATGKTL